ncbi:Tfp pilus assembly protein FimT (plasmid) [Legionella adelaidensis]|uniref:Tfp pilus assembly protein FimT n=1 Tax=Legionella adelaidensis TaxID=45056 RepID=A0A0W0R0J2_9GAMM|nr:type II secretion system protein [Legionella adelaidensis]KTC64609.1 hypothetical protein Lade_1903 [Legionella adelaidensis]VEH86076.1 Tfp pilus assembly protein FimT [Legionella adelaidensis]
MNNKKGFTLLELIVLMGIIAIVACVALLRVPQKEAFLADGFSDVLAQEIRFAQIMAIGLNQSYSIDVGNSALTIKNQAGTAVSNPETGSTLFSYPSGVSVSVASPYSIPLTIIFDPLGKPYNSSGLALTTAPIFTVTSGANTNTVTVYPETGFIE